jgi:hypothetical protein
MNTPPTLPAGASSWHGAKFENTYPFEKAEEFGLILSSLARAAGKSGEVRNSVFQKYSKAIFNGKFPLNYQIKMQRSHVINTIAADIRGRLIYTREPKGIEFIHTDIHYQLFSPWIHGDCDCMAFLTAAIFSVIYPEAKIAIIFTSHFNGRKVHHAYTRIEFPDMGVKWDDGQMFILDLVRKKHKLLKVYEEKIFPVNY